MRKFLLVALLFLPLLSVAQIKSYSYDEINFEIRINEDSTFDVTERQVFNYLGEFHAATRDIPLRLIGSLSNVQVIDGATGRALVFSSKRLDKLDPESWGKFTHYRSGGAEHLEWYYNLTNTSHEWIVKYRVHGGLTFYRDHDELYWNLFTDYTEPVRQVTARVILPPNQFIVSNLSAHGYASSVNPNWQILDNQTFIFRARNLPPGEDFTIAAGWPKGLVTVQNYWLDFIKVNWGYVFSFILALLTLFSTLIYWYISERHRFGRGAVVAQYEPPEKLKPAMAEVIVKEKITDKTWSATVIDLAIRGYLSIREEEPHPVLKIVRLMSRGLAIIFISVVFFINFLPSLLVFIKRGLDINLMFSALVPSLFILMVLGQFINRLAKSPRSFFFPPDYVLLRLKSGEGVDLENYEKEFLDILFSQSERFSTRELRVSTNEWKRNFVRRLTALKKLLYHETELDTGAYAVGVTREKYRTVMLAITLVVLFVLAIIGGGRLDFQYYFFAATTIFCVVWLIGFIKYEARLNKEGQILKEDWLGFKLYLETAEKHRLAFASRQMDPGLFEKYLPYAIIFGVEKKWGKAFQGINVPVPTWYGGGYGSLSGTGGGISGGFSASMFSSSFASSFTSAFAASGGGGGASGGGGGAGGGGGGGGGGAS